MTVPKGFNAQIFGEKTIGDAISSVADSVKLMRAPRNARHLGRHEISIAKSVFEDTIAYDRVIISDGLGFSGRPFTVPVPFTSPRKYMILAGDGYTGMSYRQEDKDLLIHELTHVWQGHHSTWAWSVQGSSVYHQAREGDDAYSYDKTNYKDWDSYGPEQQAQIVEDWYKAASHEANGGKYVDGQDWLMGEDDPRFRYIELNIRGHKMMPVSLKSHEDATFRYQVTQQEPRPPLTDDVLLRILRPRYAAHDVRGYGGRVKLLEEVLGRTNPAEASPLFTRLSVRRPDDRVSQFFHQNLSTMTRNNILKILQGRAAGK
jgi:hypothetical protein